MHRNLKRSQLGVDMSERISPAQIRGARGMLNWSMTDLSKAAGVSVSTVKRAEERDGPAVLPEALSLLEQAFEQAGISFLHDGEVCRGVVLKLEHGHWAKRDAEASRTFGN